MRIGTILWAVVLFSAAGAAAPDSPPATRPAPDAAVLRAPAIARAISDLDSPDWIVQYRAISQLARWRSKAPQARAPLEKLLASQAHPWVRGRALVALVGGLGDGAADLALTYARSDRPELRAAAVEALGLIGSPRGDPAVAAALKDAAPSVRYQAVIALARLRKAAAWPAVQPLLKDPDPALIRHVAAALTCIGTPQAQAQLVALLEHQDELVRLEAIRSLAGLNNADAVAPLLKHMAGDRSVPNREAAQKTLASYGPDVLRTRMLQVLQGSEADLYASAVTLLGLAADQKTCDALVKLVRRWDDPAAGGGPKDPHRRVLAEILDLLAGADPQRYQTVFPAYLQDEAAALRRAAVRGVARCPKLDRFALLKACILDKDYGARHEAIAAVKDAAQAAAPPGGILAYLSDALKSDDWNLFRAALMIVIERAGPEELTGDLGGLGVLLAGGSDSRRQWAAMALAKFGDDDAHRRIAKAQGYLTQWMVAGPFPNDRSHRGLDLVYPPEVLIDFQKAYPEFGLGPGAGFKTVAAAGDEPAGLIISPPPPAPPPAAAPAEGAEPAPAEEPTPQGQPAPALASPRRTVRYLLALPKAGDFTLSMSVSVAPNGAKPAGPNGAKPAAPKPPASDAGVCLSVLAGPKSLLRKPLAAGAAPQSVALDLSAYADTKVEIAFVVEPLGAGRGEAVLIRRPLVLADGKQVFDLAALAPSAVVCAERPGEAGTIRWQACQVTATSGALPLHDVFPPPTQYSVAYAVADFQSPAAQPARLEVDADDAAIVWLNGQRLPGEARTQTKAFDVTLAKGPNRLVAKVANAQEWWYVKARLCDAKGRRIEGVGK